MWHHPTVVEHVAALRTRGAIIVEPEAGPLASGRSGQGRLADESQILSALHAALHPRRDWSGRRLLITAGPTQEAIDPVRFISNRSSGKMGYALAEAAQARGADVLLVSGPTALKPAVSGEMQSMSVSERPLPVHAPMNQFATADGQLLVGGLTLQRLAARVGQTPFYAYDRQLLRSRVAELRAALWGEGSAQLHAPFSYPDRGQHPDRPAARRVA